MNDERDEAGLRAGLRGLAEDLEPKDALLQTVRAGYVRGVRRRRLFAAGGAAVAVLVVAGATTLLAPALRSDRAVPGVLVVTSTDSPPPDTVQRSVRSTTPASSAPAVQHSVTRTTAANSAASAPGPAIPAGGHLARLTLPDLTSPVSVPAAMVSFDADGPDVTSGPGFLMANWVGASPTAMQTVDIGTGATGTGKFRGYLVTKNAPSTDVYAPGNDTKATRTSIDIDGHAAELWSAPKGAYDSKYINPAEFRVVWQLADRQWIQVWAVGEGVTGVATFASSLTVAPTGYPRQLIPGLTVVGMTHALENQAAHISQTVGPTLDMCKADTGPLTDANECWSAVAEPADIDATDAVGGRRASPDEVRASITTVTTADGTKVEVSTRFQGAWVDRGAIRVRVNVDASADLSGTELAALAASVAVADLPLKDEPPTFVVLTAGSTEQQPITSTGG